MPNPKQMEKLGREGATGDAGIPGLRGGIRRARDAGGRGRQDIALVGHEIDVLGREIEDDDEIRVSFLLSFHALY